MLTEINKKAILMKKKARKKAKVVNYGTKAF